MSDLPPGWEWAKLGEIGTWFGGGTPSKSKPEYWLDATIPWLSPKDMGSNVLAGTQDKISQLALANSAVRLVPSNSVAIVVRSGILERRLPVAVVPFGTTLNQDMRAVVPFAGVSPRWVAYFLRSIESQILKKCAKRGTTVASIDVPSLMDIPVPIAPGGEQERILAVLEGHLSRVDAAEKSLRAVFGGLNRFEQALLDSVALGRDQRLEGSESFVELLHRTPKKIDYGSLPSLPSSWRWRVASDVCSSIECGSTPKSHLMYPGEGEIPFLKVYNLTRWGVVDFSVRPTFVDRATHDSLLKRSRVYPGDVLTNIVGPPLGKTAVVPDSWPEWNINQAIVAFRAGSEVNPGWLEVVLRSPFVLGLLRRTARATAGQFNISLSTCRELPIPVPPLVEQLALVESTRERIRGLRRLEKDVGLLDRRNSALRRSLLVEAFAGGLVPQDAHEEPASALLERLRLERVTQLRNKRVRRAVNQHQETTL
ncbi:restriction endonuclease subunit S [Lentzea sp. NPDC004782]|uniref:restriction endonuclease subunit S n=1 Tax=Lentzea sp. NPDC004782 TaxID=3154458 RepID=UPI0033B7C805